MIAILRDFDNLKKKTSLKSTDCYCESEEGEIVAFANIMPTKNKRVATIDLMRYDFEKAPEGIMDYLFVKLFQYFQAEGKQYFDMGMAPLANVGTKRR